MGLLQANLPLCDAAERVKLMAATCVGGQVPVVELLLAEGVDVHAPLQDGWTALLIAVRSGHLAVVDFLVVQGVGVNFARR